MSPSLFCPSSSFPSTLTHPVPPHTPSCEIPTSALTGAVVEMRCKDNLSFPPATYKWYKNNKPLSIVHLPNLSYTQDTHSGTLHFRTVSRADSGQYRCEASNGVGAPKSCEGKHLKIDDMNMTLILAAGGGGLFLLSVCFLGICCACWRCCRSESTSQLTQSLPLQPLRQPIAKYCSSRSLLQSTDQAENFCSLNVSMATLDWTQPKNHQWMDQAEHISQRRPAPTEKGYLAGAGVVRSENTCQAELHPKPEKMDST
ncbi:hypothetical protein JZ751_029165 [Albula glossodonta]|uniref:Ig-like domain-containing protein n=1 Tax=Albula glossodonta TaxID=121402 RepID=A0A8T2PH95_9TELE|nr:hypothetical protein JZ751_029165 [Albula glossodonta]